MKLHLDIHFKKEKIFNVSYFPESVVTRINSVLLSYVWLEFGSFVPLPVFSLVLSSCWLPHCPPVCNVSESIPAHSAALFLKWKGSRQVTEQGCRQCFLQGSFAVLVIMTQRNGQWCLGPILKIQPLKTSKEIAMNYQMGGNKSYYKKLFVSSTWSSAPIWQ